MFVKQFFIKGIAHSSYLLGGDNICAIVDPSRDIDIYIEAAEEMGMKITHILETHLHADFVSGHMELADVTGATIYAPLSGKCTFEHEAVREGDSFQIENMKLEVIDTPGHTPEGICYIVTDMARGEDPVAIFTGDTLFVGDVGRPDLFPGMAEELASKLYDSLHDKIMRLPDFCEVYPAHGAGSLCGRAMGAKRSSTIGYEKRFNKALQIKDRQEFIKSLTTDMPAAPDHFARCSDINRQGPAISSELPVMMPMKPGEAKELIEGQDAVVLDCRCFEAFGGAHVPGAYSIDFGGNFATFAGWVIPPDKPLLLVALDEYQAYEALIWLRRVGLDNVAGYLEGGMFSWAVAGLDSCHVQQISVKKLYDLTLGNMPINIVDVRADREFAGHHIEGAVNIAVQDLRTRYTELDANLPTVTICGSGHRSSLGASLLKQRGFREVLNVAGGMTGFTAAGFAPECPVCRLPHGPQFLGKDEE